jgi:myo-inositol-1(or 4)-monophosphatase
MPALSPRLSVLDKLCRSASQKQRRYFLDLERNPIGTANHTKTWQNGIQFAAEIFQEGLKTGYPTEKLLLKGFTPYAENDWFIDPVGNLENFQHAREPLAFVAAHSLKGKVQQGMVYVTMQDEAFHVSHGEGSWGPRTRLRVSSRSELTPETLVGCYGLKGDDLAKVASSGAQLRIGGVALLEATQVAAGLNDGIVADNLLPTEAQLAALFVHEAGGMATDRTGQPIGAESTSLVAANSKLHAKLLKTLQGK